MITEAQLAKLPKYAQDEVIALRRKVEELRREFVAQQQTVPTKVRWGYKLMNDDAFGYVPDYETVFFQVTEHPNRHIRIRLTERGLNVNADGRLILMLRSSNDCDMSLEP